MQGFSVDYDRCIRCGQCISACAKNVLKDNGEGGPTTTPERIASHCNACGHCSAVCPVQAVISPKCNGEAAIPLDAKLAVSYDEARQFLLSCRSIRMFKPQSLSKNEILELLDLARKAPSASNSQQVRWIVISGREKAQRVSELVIDWFDTVVRNDPQLVGNYNVDAIVNAYKNGYDGILRGAPDLLCAVAPKTYARGATDAAIAMTYFCLAAHSKNIGSCWAGFVMRAGASYAPLRQYLKLDDNTALQAAAFFGYPEVEYAAIPPRKALQAEWL